MKETITAAKEVEVDHHHHANHHKHNDRSSVSIETLINFLHTRQYRHLTFPQLNKILSLHGLKRSKLKKDAEEILSTITEPIHPARSTVNDRYKSSASRKAEITFTEAMKDLKSLNWQMCSVTSIKTISSKNYSNYAPATLFDSIPASEVAAKLMSLKGVKRQIAPDATSMMSNDNEWPGAVKKKRPGVKRVYLKNPYTSDDANTLPACST